MILSAQGKELKRNIGFLRGFHEVKPQRMQVSAVGSEKIWPDIYVPYEDGKGNETGILARDRDGVRSSLRRR